MDKFQKNVNQIPQKAYQRSELQRKIEEYVTENRIAPPFAMQDLDTHCDAIIEHYSIDPQFKQWCMVQISNAAWKSRVAAIPYERRILLIPQCLRNSRVCSAEIDEFGLLCHKCNSCTINTLQDRADELGIMSIVAEGFTSVVALVESGQVEAVIGVGCLESLERAFELMVKGSVAGIAIPLNCAGCRDTNVDSDYVEQMMSIASDEEPKQSLKSVVNGWFSQESIMELIGNSTDHPSVIAREWLASNGKRWRPYLVASVYQAITGCEQIPDTVKQTAIAIECFHKASLIHDDIEDEDYFRYGERTLNSLYGNAIAINAGDIMLGWGYELLAQTGNIEIIRAAAKAHKQLCIGQGIELEWSAQPRELTMDLVLEIIKNKTVPAFDVAIDCGAICAGADDDLRELLHRYSLALGTAYQLRDDIEDYEQGDLSSNRPTALLAAKADRQSVETMIVHYQEQARKAVSQIVNSDLRTLLTNLIHRILH